MGFGVEEPWPLTLNSSLWRSSSLVTFDPAWGHVYCQHIPHILSPWLPGVHMSDWLRAEFREEDISPSCFQNKSIIGLFRGKQNTFICNGLLLYCVLLVLLEHNQELLDLLEDSGVDPQNLLTPTTSLKHPWIPLETVLEHPQGSIEWMYLLNFLQGLQAESRWSVTPGGWRVKHRSSVMWSHLQFRTSSIKRPIYWGNGSGHDLKRNKTKKKKKETSDNQKEMFYSLCVYWFKRLRAVRVCMNFLFKLKEKKRKNICFFTQA